MCTRKIQKCTRYTNFTRKRNDAQVDYAKAKRLRVLFIGLPKCYTVSTMSEKGTHGHPWGRSELQPAALSSYQKYNRWLLPGAGAAPQIGSAAGTIPLMPPRCPRAQNCTLLHPGLLLLAFPPKAQPKGTPARGHGRRCCQRRHAAATYAALQAAPQLCPLYAPGRAAAGHRNHTNHTSGAPGAPAAPQRHPGAAHGSHTEGCRPGPGTPPGAGWGSALWGVAPARCALARHRGPLSYGPLARPLARWPCHPARPAARGMPGQRGTLAGGRARPPLPRHRGGRGGRLLRWCSAPPAPCMVVGPLGPRPIHRQRRATLRPGTCRRLASSSAPRPAPVGCSAGPRCGPALAPIPGAAWAACAAQTGPKGPQLDGAKPRPPYLDTTVTPLTQNRAELRKICGQKSPLYVQFLGTIQGACVYT